MNKYLLDEVEEQYEDRINFSKYIFKGLEKEIRIVHFNETENIVQFDQPLDHLYLIIEGKAKVTMVHEDGKRSIVRFLTPMELIGELSLIEVDDQPKDIEAVSNCTCLAVPITMAKKILLKDCEFLLKLNQYIGGKLLERTWFQMKFQNYELKNRLAAYMLMSEHNGLYTEKHTETAEYLNVSYRHLLHTIKLFLDDETIKKTPQGYALNIDALDELSMDILDKRY